MGKVAFFILAALLSAGGCARRQTEATKAAAEHTLIVGNYAEPEDLDPQIVTIYTDQNILLALFEGLTAIDETTSQAVPAQASSWESSEDGLTWTFHLKAGLRWSNGEPLTADDFVASWRRMLAPAFAADYAYLLYPIRNAQAINEGRLKDPSLLGVSAPDAVTVRIELERRTPYLPILVGLPPWFPVNPRVLARFGALTARGTKWTRPGNLVGNGPFTLKEWTPNARIVVDRNPSYWNASGVSLNRMIFVPIENPDTEERDFRSGQLHITSSVPISKISAYRKEAPNELRTDPFSQTYFLRCNVTRAPFDDPRVRRALSLAVDRDAISHRVLIDTRGAAHAFTPEGTGDYSPRARVDLELDQARRLLAESGHPGGRGIRPFEIMLKDDGIEPQVAQAIQEMWSENLGVHATLATLEQKTLIQNQQNLNYDIAFASWAADFLDPVTFLGLFTSDGGNNWTGWKDAEYDRLISEASNTADPRGRMEVFQRAESALLQSGPVIPLYFGAQNYLIDQRVSGWLPAKLGYHRYSLVHLGN
jgi:oligopeptide transport system substrate-binding protein